MVIFIIKGEDRWEEYRSFFEVDNGELYWTVVLWIKKNDGGYRGLRIRLFF